MVVLLWGGLRLKGWERFAGVELLRLSSILKRRGPSERCGCKGGLFEAFASDVGGLIIGNSNNGNPRKEDDV